MSVKDKVLDAISGGIINPFPLPIPDYKKESISCLSGETIPISKDPVNHPSHYKSNGIEVIDVIESFKLNYHLGNVIKYICRAGKKDPSKYLEDLKKAAFYLKRNIENLEKEIQIDKIQG